MVIVIMMAFYFEPAQHDASSNKRSAVQHKTNKNTYAAEMGTWWGIWSMMSSSSMVSWSILLST